MSALKEKTSFSKKWGLLFLTLGLLTVFSCGDNTDSGSGLVATNFDWNITVQPLFTSLRAGNSTLVNIQVTDRNGSPPPIKDQNEVSVTNTVYLSTDSGSISSSVVLDSYGWGIATYNSSTRLGQATIRATFKGSIGQATIIITSTLT